jgi:hypothetical protein
MSSILHHDVHVVAPSWSGQVTTSAFLEILQRTDVLIVEVAIQ